MNRKIICKNSGCTGKTINLRSGDVKVNLSGAEVNSGDAKLTLVHLVQRFIRPLASHTRVCAPGQAKYGKTGPLNLPVFATDAVGFRQVLQNAGPDFSALFGFPPSLSRAYVCVRQEDG